MAREFSRLRPCTSLPNNFMSLEYFRGQQSEDAINCSQMFTTLLEKDSTDTPLSEFCSAHPQINLHFHCKQCGVDICKECAITIHRRHKYTTSSNKVREETQRLGEAADSVIGQLEEVKRAICRVKEMKQRVRNRKDNNINVTREVFATLRKAIDKREEQTIDDIKEAAYEREKALEVVIYAYIQYRSFITSLLHACTRMVPRSIWRVKILGLPWKKFFPRDESWHLAWHFTTRVLTFP